MTSTFPYLIGRCYRQCQNARHQAFSTTLRCWFPSRSSSYYDLLGIKTDATLEEIKQAFFSKSKKLHPDSDPTNPDLHHQFVKLNEAYRVLSKERSRRGYDSLRAAQGPAPCPSSPRRSPFDFGSSGPRSESETNENIRYWQQFHKHPPEFFSGPEFERKKVHNRNIFGYCLLLMLGGLLVHFIVFRKLEEVHNRFMDEKDRIITQIYYESKERARSNSLQKQKELLRQKHAELTQRIRPGQLPPTAGSLDSIKDQASPSSADR